MIKYSKFTDNIESGNFTDGFSQITDRSQKKLRKGGVTPPPHTPARDTLGFNITFSLILKAFGGISPLELLKKSN